MARRILHVDMDAFFVSVEQVLRPELKGKPVVVGGKPDRRGVVAAASYEARAFGLHSGMPLVTASRLCPQAIFIEGSFARYRDASRKFMAILADFSPHLEPAGLDEAYLDVTGFESLHGSVKNMAAAIKQRIRDELSLCASIGIAGGKVVAKVASDKSKPDGLLEVPEGQEGAFLAPLPVGDLPGVGKKGRLVLKGMGITTLGQLAALPVSVLKGRFGSYGVTLHNHASGIDDSRVTAPGEAKSISRETTFAEDVRDAALLTATLRYLGERVGGSLRQQGKRARCVSLKLRYADFTTITRQQTLARPQDTDQAIFAAGARLLDRELATGKQAVRLIGIGVSGLTPGRQLDMFAAADLRLERLNKAIDRIREKYGFRAIQTGRTLRLRDVFPGDGKDYTLPTPSLSR
jgi:DNA polymerase-4